MFTDPAVTMRRGLDVRFEMNSIYVSTRRLHGDRTYLTKGDGAPTSSARATEAILSHGAGERL